MASTDTIDPYLVAALKLLHSSAPDSAAAIRAMLDNEISKLHDKNKTISAILTKKQLNDEKLAPGSGFKKHKAKKPEEVKVPVRVPTPEEEQIPIPIDDDSSSEPEGAVDGAEMDLLMDSYTCETCRQIDSSANNQLFECIECHLLHHQLCHLPKISNDTSLTSWVCSACKDKKEKEKEKEKESSTKSTKSYESSGSSSSSNSSIKKPKIKIEIKEKEKEKKVEAPKKKSSSSSSSSRSRSSKK